jgi:hypothetical protein
MARPYFKSRLAPETGDTEASSVSKLVKILGPGTGDKVIVTGTSDNTTGPYFRIQAAGAANVVIDTLTAADWNGGTHVTTDLTLAVGNSIYSDRGFSQVKLTSGVAILYK